jgi:hypothetical protein
MRVEATLPDLRGVALDQLADDLGLSRSQVVDEAIGLFLKAVVEARRGHRLCTMAGDALVCELSTPTLAAIEWAGEWSAAPQTLHVSDSAMDAMAALIAKPPVPGTRLKQAMRRKR